MKTTNPMIQDVIDNGKDAKGQDQPDKFVKALEAGLAAQNAWLLAQNHEDFIGESGEVFESRLKEATAWKCKDKITKEISVITDKDFAKYRMNSGDYLMQSLTQLPEHPSR